MNLAILTNGLTAASLVAVMLAMGLGVTMSEVWTSARQIRLVLLGILANFVLVPLATAALLYAYHANPMASVGFFVLAVSPGAPVGPPMTAVARGDVPFSIAMMIVLAVLSAFLSPALLGLLVPFIAPANDLQIDYIAIVRTLLLFQLLPLACGLGLRRWARRFADQVGKPVRLLANGMMLVLICLIAYAQVATLAALSLRVWTGMILLLLVSLGIGWISGGSRLGSRRAMAVTTASRNAAVGLVIANRNFADTPAVVAVVAYGLFCILGTLALAAFLRRYRTSESGHVEASH
jgi:BASS family bile acid:Na+ symporter